ncbi:MAG TPA: hypothetical protein VHQ24_12885 [Lachnospiraceae bacterium]|nr:hypothetical protein [Lachnospiraceae bacterium]
MNVFTGTNDILTSQAHSLLTKAEKLELTIDFNERESLMHVYPLFPIPEAEEAIQRMEAIVRGDL